jgi:hypothetical protein
MSMENPWISWDVMAQQVLQHAIPAGPDAPTGPMRLLLAKAGERPIPEVYHVIDEGRVIGDVLRYAGLILVCGLTPFQDCLLLRQRRIWLQIC